MSQRVQGHPGALAQVARGALNALRSGGLTGQGGITQRPVLCVWRWWVLAFAAAASAAPPAQFREDGDVQLIDDQTCPFPITLNYHVTATGRDLFDNNGNWIGAVVEQNTVGTDTANGVSLPDADHYVDHWNAQGDRETGLVIHVSLPSGGVLIRDAGNVQFGWDGSITFVHGPHPLVLGDTAAYCAAFG